jgi:hypothetical protein
MAELKEPNAEALAAFIARKAEIDCLLEQLLAHSHEHLNLATEEVHWGHVPSWTTGWPACGGWRSWLGCCLSTFNHPPRARGAPSLVLAVPPYPSCRILRNR